VFAYTLSPLDGVLSSTKSLIHTLSTAKLDSDVEVVIAPPAIYLVLVKETLTNTAIKVAAQNVFDKGQGAYTGEISYFTCPRACS
jgi:triosephosphate isomerase (TIM)